MASTNIYFVDIGAEDTNFVDIGSVDIELLLTQLACSLHSSSNRCPTFSPTIVVMLGSLSHRDLWIYKIYIIDEPMYLQHSASTNTLLIDDL